MRLLEACDGPDGLEFRLTGVHHPGNTPLYAILSHTWGLDSEEVSLQDLRDDVGKAKAGYDKLRFCARQARRDGLTHFWIDTCCIDKSNSTELAEALNSMFRWYQRATRCYVFLPDVASATDPEAWTPSFRASRWFTRGWTLQELIAPKTVQFFAKDSSLLGDKGSLLPLIAEITGIAEAALAGEPLDGFSIQERFSWTEKRQTKREEDWAYSLLGIFGVFISPIYGEGRENAERRLRNEIRASFTAGKQLETQEAHFVVPYLSNPDFVQRPELFEELKAQLGYESNYTDRTSQSRVSLFGLGGVGKTQIAIAFVYWLRQMHPGVSVFWVHASTTERFQQAYTSFAQQLRILEEDIPGRDTLEIVKLWLERKAAGRWLLVIDNADDTEIFFRPKNTPSDNVSSSIKHLARYIPECSHVSVLVTTRNKQTGLRLTQQRRPIAVGNMDDLESQQLLSAKLDDSTSKDRQRLATRLESLPLALAQAAAFIQENCISISEYIELLDESPAEVLDTEFEAPGRDLEIPHAVMQTWKISFEQIKRDNPLAGDLLSFMGLLDRQAIPREFLTAYVELFYPEPRNSQSVRLTTALGILKAVSFLTEDKTSGLEMHRLVHLSTQRWLEGKEDLCRFSGQAFQALTKVLPEESRSIYEDTCGLYLPHVQAVLKHRHIDSTPNKLWRASLLSQAAVSLCGMQQFANAKTLIEECLALRKSLHGHVHKLTFETTAILENIEAREEQERAYQAMLEAAYDYYTRHGAESHWTLPIISEMAVIYTIQDRHEEAEALRIRISGTAREISGSKMDPATLVFMSNLATTYLEKGQLEKAKDLQVQVVQLQKERGLGEEHPDIIRAIDLLSETINEALERSGEAFPLVLGASETRRRRLEARRRRLEATRRRLDAVSSHLVLHSVAKFDLGRKLGHKFVSSWWKGIETATRRWGEDDPRTLQCMGMVAIQYSEISWLQVVSFEMWSEIFRRMTRMPGHQYRETLAMTASHLNQQLEGGLEGYYTRELALNLFEATRRVLGEDDSDTLATISTVSSMFFKAERYAQCLDWALRDVEVQRKLLGEDHPEITWRLLRVSRVQVYMERFKEALTAMQCCLQPIYEVMGRDGLETLAGKCAFATMLKVDLSTCYPEALILMQQVLEAAERRLGLDHELIIEARRCMENWVEEAERVKEGGNPGDTTLQDQKDTQETPPKEIDGTQVADSKDSNDVEELRPTPPGPDTEPSAAPSAEPGKEKDQHIPSTATNTDTDPSPEAPGVQDEESTPSQGKRKRESQSPPRWHRTSKTNSRRQP